MAKKQNKGTIGLQQLATGFLARTRSYKKISAQIYAGFCYAEIFCKEIYVLCQKLESYCEVEDSVPGTIGT